VRAEPIMAPASGGCYGQFLSEEYRRERGQPDTRINVLKTRPVIIGILLALGAASATSEASAGYSARSKEKLRRAPPPAERVERDCTPINGRYGYYGNPWCDTGSSRPPDIEFREHQRLRGW